MNYYEEDYGKSADKGATRQGFERAKRDIAYERNRVCQLVDVLLKILDKKLLNKDIEWKGGKKKVRDILFHDIDP